MNVIFLDMDGVLCTPRANVALGQKGVISYLDPVACQLLIQLIREFSATVVISSTWRFDGKQRFCEKLKCAGWHEIVNAISLDEWCTPDLARVKNAKRGDEVAAWLETREVENYLILDDDTDFLEYQMPHFVKCHGHDGIGFWQYIEARRVLGGSDEY